MPNSADIKYQQVPDDTDIQEETNKKIGRLQWRSLRSRHKQHLVNKKDKAFEKQVKSTALVSSSSSTTSDA